MKDIMEILDGVGAETEEALERFLDDREMYEKYVRNFPEEPSMSALNKAVAEKDYVAAEKAVHALKGIVNNLGFLPLADAAIDMLAELRDDNIEDALDAYEDVKKQYKIFTDAINGWKSEE